MRNIDRKLNSHDIVLFCQPKFDINKICYSNKLSCEL